MQFSLRRDYILFGFQLCCYVCWGNRGGQKEDLYELWGRFRSTSRI
jgi:hypothetical protein